VTALDIIKRAMRLIGVYAIGEDPTAAESQDGLAALNSLLASISNESLLVYARSKDAIALSAGQSSFTIGPTGTTASARPVKVLDESYVEFGGVSYPLQVLTLAQYNDIAIKTLSSIPQALYVQADMPDATVHLWPQPSEAMTLNLWSDKLVTSFPSLTTVVSLPPGYDRLLAFALAIDLAPEYEREPSQTVIRQAMAARRVLKRTNTEVPQLDMPYGVPNRRGFRDIREF
jgi:hypothetical protein